MFLVIYLEAEIERGVSLSLSDFHTLEKSIDTSLLISQDEKRCSRAFSFLEDI